MITFEYMRFHNDRVTLDLLEGCAFVARTAMIDTVSGNYLSALLSAVSGSWASSSCSDGFTTYTGSGEVKVANINGACVAHMTMIDNTQIWFNSSTGTKVGVLVENDKITFANESEVKLVRECTPNFDAPFRLAYQLEFDADMLLVYQSIVLYNADKVLGGLAFDSSADVDNISVDVDGTFSVMLHELYRPVSYLTIDVTEAPQESIARLTANLPVVYFGRYDGSMHVFRTDITRDSVLDLSQYHNLASSVALKTDGVNIVTRARVTGALPEGESFDLSMASKYLLRFKSFQNPEIISRQQAIDEASRLLKKNFQDTHSAILSWHAFPFLEIGDVVEINGVRYVYSDAQYSFSTNMFGTVNLALESAFE